MVATVRSKRAQDRLRGALPFYEHLAEMAGRLLAGPDPGALHPLFRKPERVRRAVVLLLTSDRGLCGGYNARAIAAGRAELKSLRERGAEVELHVAGKKGLSYFRYVGQEVHKALTGLDDKARYEDVEPLAQAYMDGFLVGDLDRVLVVGHHYLSSSQQAPKTFRLLPVAAPAGPEAGGGALDFEFLPSAASILEALVPFEVKTALYTRILEAGTSEQIARRVAMKLATDNAEEMLKTLRQKYNRARQTQITMEISDIMGGTSAIAR
jgi:F-type H+-transporting ATPase subunit gamma